MREFYYSVPSAVLSSTGTPYATPEFYAILKHWAKSNDQLQGIACFNPPELIIKSCSYIRTADTNEILCTKNDTVFYSDFSGISTQPFSLHEIGLLNIQNYFLNAFNFEGVTWKSPFEIKLAQSLHSFPVGAFVFDDKVYVCSNIIVSEDYKPYLREGYEFKGIKSLNIANDPIVKAMSSTFVFVSAGGNE